MVVLAGVVLFMLAAGICLALERARLLTIVGEQEEVNRHDKAIDSLTKAVGEAIFEMNNVGFNASNPERSQTMSSVVRRALYDLDRIGREHRSAAAWSAAIGSRIRAVSAVGTDASWNDLREVLRGVRGDLEEDRMRTSERMEQLRARFVETYDLIGYTWLGLALLGVVGIGATIGWFFARLARDLKLLERRAGEIVGGYRGKPLALRRGDEVESLAAAVNRMAADLRDWELRLQLEQQRRAYHDKMAALGALAAGAAHEVNNPLTAIAGAATEIRGGGQSARDVADGATRILAEVRRVAAAMRQISMFARPQPSEYEAVDLNELLRRSVGLMQYDRRFRQVRFELELAADLPAVHTVPARLQQALFDLVGVSAEAMSANGGSVAICTRHEGHTVELQLQDRRGAERAKYAQRALASPADSTGSGANQVHDLALADATLGSLNGKMVVEAAADGLRLTVSLPVETTGT